MASMAAILSVLRHAKVLGKGKYDRSEVLRAMKDYRQRWGLPPMQTFNGLAARILRSVDISPTTREVIEVRN